MPRPRTADTSAAAATVAALITVIALVVSGGRAGAQATEPPERVLGDLAFPTNLAFAPDGTLFFTEKDTGRIRVMMPGGALQPEPFATLDVALVANETGLLGLALHPDFDREPWVYAYYSDAATVRNVLVRIRSGAEAGDVVGGEIERLGTFLPATAGYHNGGDMVFGIDGMLYLAVGEAHEPARAQDPEDPGGSILRLTPEGAPAPGNPFGADTPAYTIGHRNSFGVCVDPASGTVWMTENGPGVDDEVNRLEPGGNYGWPEVTGDADDRFADPVLVFTQPVAPTGCAVWEGSLWFGTYITGELFKLDLDGGRPARAYAFGAPVIAMEVAPDGDLYVATSSEIVRFEGTSPTPSPSPTRTSTPGPPTLSPIEPVTLPGAEEPGGPRRAITIVAAVVLAVALVARLIAGRRLRRRGSDGG